MQNKHTEVRRTPRRNDLAVGDALEENGLVAGTGRVTESADCLGRLVFVGGQEVVETFMAEVLHEPFAVCVVLVEVQCYVCVGEERRTKTYI